MPTMLVIHEVEDVDHWLKPPERGEGVRPSRVRRPHVVDPTESHRIGLIVEGPGLEELDLAGFVTGGEFVYGADAEPEPIWGTPEMTLGCLHQPQHGAPMSADDGRARGERAGGRRRRSRQPAPGTRPAKRSAAPWNGESPLLEFAEGALARLRVPVPAEDAGAGRDVLTDIDVLSTDVDTRLRISRSSLECKSGKGQTGEPMTLVWLAGFRQLLSRGRVVFVRPSVSSRGRALPRRLAIAVLDEPTIAVREAAHQWLPERFAHIDGDACTAAEARTDRQLKGLLALLAEVTRFLRSEALLASSSALLAAVERLGAAADRQGVLPEPSHPPVCAGAHPVGLGRAPLLSGRPGPADIGISPDEWPTSDRDTVKDLGTGRGAACRSPWRDPDSPLSWFQRMLDRLRECAEVGVGDHEVIDVRLPQVLVHRASTTGGRVLFAHNLADRPVTVRVSYIGAHVRATGRSVPRPGVRRARRTRTGRLRLPLDPARRRSLFGQPSREPPELVKPPA
jgi:hypothetical protein